jgi:hypothetical protein
MFILRDTFTMIIGTRAPRLARGGRGALAKKRKKRKKRKRGRRQDREAKGKQAGNFLLIKFRDGIKFE